jgi:hydrogenase 3 maturation protease
LKEPEDTEIRARVRDLIRSEKTLVIGIGNTDRADDGAGIKIVDSWKARLKKRAFLEPETPAEIVVSDHLADPLVDALVFVDAADFGGKPGEVRLFGSEDADGMPIPASTHKIPLGLLFGLIRQKGKAAYLLGIQPKSLEWIGEMSEEVRETVKRFETIPD